MLAANPETVFGSYFARPIGSRALPQRIVDTESYVDLWMANFLSPDGEWTEFLIVGEDACLDESERDRLAGVMLANMTVGHNHAGYDRFMIAAAIAGLTAGELKKFSSSMITSKEPSWMVARAAGINPSWDWSILDTGAFFSTSEGMVGLKKLAMSLGEKRIEDAPFSFDERVGDRVDVVRLYNRADCLLVKRLMLTKRVSQALDAREVLTRRFGVDVMTMKDASVGEAIIVSLYVARQDDPEMDRRAMKAACAAIEGGRPVRLMIPTFPGLRGSDSVEKWKESINATTFPIDSSGRAIVRSQPIVTAGGLMVQLGSGGAHSKDGAGMFVSTDRERLILIDVSSYYPSQIARFGIHPLGLTEDFCTVVDELLQIRMAAKRDGDKALADALKIPLNAIFGKMGEPTSAIASQTAFLTVTMVGQYLICVLAEMLLEAGARPVSANTDGIFAMTPIDRMEHVADAISRWEKATGLSLDQDDFVKYVRTNGNNYLAVDVDGGVKTKGASFNAEASLMAVGSNRIAQRAVVDYFVSGTPVRETIYGSTDLDDFTFKKTRKGVQVYFGDLPVAASVRAYPTTDSSVPSIWTPSKDGTGRNTVFSRMRHLPVLPDSIPDDLDRSVAISAAAQTIALIEASEKTGHNERARELEGVGLPIRPRDALGEKGSTPAKEFGADYSRSDILVTLGKDKGDRWGFLALLPIEHTLTFSGRVVGHHVRRADGEVVGALVALDASGAAQLEARQKKVKTKIVGALKSGIVPIVDDAFDFVVAEDVEDGVGQDPDHVVDHVLPALPAPVAVDGAAFPTDNDAFLDAVFGDASSEAWVCSNFGAPDHPDQNQRPRWIGGPRRFSRGVHLDAGRGNYFCVSTFRPNSDESVSRQIDTFAGLHWILIDDVGTKVTDPRSKGWGTPTWVVETSAGNYQYGYLLDSPIADRAVAEGLMSALVRADGLTDKSSGNITRVGRLPFGTNMKLRIGANFACRLVEWNPGARYAPGTLAAWIGVDLDVMAARARLASGVGASVGIVTDEALAVHPWVLAFGDRGMLLDVPVKRDERGIAWLRVLCPWLGEHTDGDTSGSYLRIGADGVGFKCHHGACSGEVVGAGGGVRRERGASSVREWFAADGVSLPMPDGSVPGSTFEGLEFVEALHRARVGTQPRHLRNTSSSNDEEVDVNMGFGDDLPKYSEAGGEQFDYDDGVFGVDGVDPDIAPESIFDEPVATDYVIDGMIPEGVAAIAGQPGIGKSSMIGTLALTTTGLLRHDPKRDGLNGGPVGGAFGIRCSYPRRVVWVTEDLIQARQIIRGMCIRWRISLSEAGKMIRLVEGRRLPVEGLVKKVERVMTKREGEIEPLLIIDTMSSSIALDDENDNSKVAEAIDVMKTAFFTKKKSSIWLIGHTSKPTSRTDSAATMRGASSIGGNVNSTFALVLDPEIPDSRFLVIGKIRGGKSAKEIEFIGEPFTETAVNRHGDRVQIKVVICTARPLGDGDREAAKDAEKMPALHAEMRRIVDDARPCYAMKGRGKPRSGENDSFTRITIRDVVRDAVANLNLKISHANRDACEVGFLEIVPASSENDRFWTWE